MVLEYDFQKVIDNMYDGLYLVDRERRIVYWNHAAERISGFSAAEVVGKLCADSVLNHVDGFGNELCKSTCPLAATIADGQSRDVEVYLHHKEGHRLPVSVRTAPIRDARGTITGAIELFTDISFHNALQLQLEEWKKVALMDPLTELANRRQLEMQLHARLHELQRNEISCGVLFIDIDNFKQVNDRYGHDIGDQVLRTIANTLTATIRPFDIVGRWGGEEFVGIFPHTTSQSLRRIADRLRALIRHSVITTDTGPLSFTVSIGATFANSNDTIDIVIKRADSLMYESKQKGKNCVTMGKEAGGKRKKPVSDKH